MTYIKNDGSVVFTEYEYVLDIIATNLNIYGKDIFRNNVYNFGNDGMNINDTENVKQTVEKIIKNRCSTYQLTVDSCTVNNGKIELSISGTFGQKTIEVNFDNKDNLFNIIAL